MKIKTVRHTTPADLHTPVGIYLKMRDVFRETCLLESTDHENPNQSKSIICINPIAGIEIIDKQFGEVKMPFQSPEKFEIDREPTQILEDFRRNFDINHQPLLAIAQSLFGYMSYDTVQFFEDLDFNKTNEIPLVRYRLYQYVLVIDNYTDELHLYENLVDGVKSELIKIQNILQNRDFPLFPFNTKGEEQSNLTDEQYVEMVEKGIAHGKRGDVFQIVLSRKFQQSFVGDEFQVYRALRNINPSPYLFYFDYSDYKLFGSSPESQMIVKDQVATIHPIAGTFKRTKDFEKDAIEAERLKEDAKENAEHTMLVDLARNDLSKVCTDVKVTKLKEIQYFSHVIHMVSEVKGNVTKTDNPFEVLAATFPQGTLSGAPKHRALELIDDYEPTSREYYGGSIGLVGLNGDINTAIMIRTFMSKNNQLNYQAGAGVVVKSDPQSEMQEVLNKLGALKKAIELAKKISL
ncbi:MAG: anthranilate synthase component I family protein [Weeksellaceae bacterium]